MDSRQFNTINVLNTQINQLGLSLDTLNDCDDHFCLSTSTKNTSMEGTSLETSSTASSSSVISKENIGTDSYRAICDALEESIEKELVKKKAKFKEIEIPNVPGYEK